MRLSRGWIRAGLLMALVVLAAAAGPVIQTWRSDALARTFRNSTLPYRDPTPEKLRRARLLAPGNAAYWLWTAERLRMKPEEKEDLLTPGEALLPDPTMALLNGGLRRNPTAWPIWREMAWNGFFRSSASEKGRAADLERAMKHIQVTASLRPADNRLRMERGVIALAAQGEKSPAATAEDWQRPFQEVIRENPKLAGTIADLVILHLGAKGAATLARFLPPDAESHLQAAAFLLSQGHLDAGMDLVRRGERERGEQVARLWEEVRQTGAWGDVLNNPQLRKVAALDPSHPGALLARGEILPALQSMERRGEPVAAWGDARVLAARIEAEREAKKGDPVQQAYALGLLARERGDEAKAIWWMNRTLNLNSQHFNACLRLHDLLQGRTRSAADQIQWEALEKRIRLYAMDQVVSDAWKWRGVRSGKPAWVAPFRVAGNVEKARIRFSGDRGTVWALELDGRFAAVWKGPAWEGQVTLKIPPGEHEFRVTTWSQELKGDGQNLPFHLEIAFRH